MHIFTVSDFTTTLHSTSVALVLYKAATKLLVMIAPTTRRNNSGDNGVARIGTTQQQLSRQRFQGFRRGVKSSDDDGDPCPEACSSREQTRTSIRAWIRQQQQQQPPLNQQGGLRHLDVGTDADVGTPDSAMNRRRSGFQRLHQLLTSHKRRGGGHDLGLMPPLAEIQCEVFPQIPERLHVPFHNQTLQLDPFNSMNLPGTRRPATNLLDDDSDDDIQEYMVRPPVDAGRDVSSRSQSRSPPETTVATTLPGTRQSATNLFDDDSDDDIQEQLVQCLKSAARISPHDDTTEADSYAHHLLDFFPDAHPQRIMDLLRQESLTSALIILAEESSVKPADELACRTELKPATTYAQATDENRTKILLYVRDMFPQIPASEIESILMQHSIHHGVSILSSNTP